MVSFFFLFVALRIGLLVAILAYYYLTALAQHHVPFCSDLSVWCFACDSYLDAQSILELRPVYEVAHLLKFGERPPFRSLEVLDLSSGQNGGSSSSS
jgi:hypothetical protein